jgi:hypothetical protein
MSLASSSGIGVITQLIVQRWRAPVLLCRHHTIGLYYKTSMIVIYDCNDSGQYYKTTITIVCL